MTKTIEKKKSKLFKKLAKKNGWKVTDIKLKKCDPADLRGIPVVGTVGAGWQTPRTAEQVFETFMDELRPVTVDELRQSYEHITNRLHPTIANRKPWPAWPEVKATDELHKEFLSKDKDKKLHEMKEDIYFLLQRVEAQFGRHHWVSKDISVVLDKWERS